jgi:tight adherence protein B
MWTATVFGLIFGSVTLLLFALTSGQSAAKKQAAHRLETIRLALVQQDPSAQSVDVRLHETFSTLPWLDRYLQRANLGPKLRLLLQQADLHWTVGRLLLMCMMTGLGLGYLVYWRTGAAVLSLFMTVAAGACPIFFVLNKRTRRFDRIRSLLPDAIDLMVAAIRAGHSLSSAIGMVARESPEPVRGEFRQCYDEQNFGLDLRSAMANLEHRVPVQDIRIINAAVLIQREAGGNLTEILEKVGYLIREDFRLQRQVRVHSAQGRLTGYILGIFPLVMGIGMYMVNPKNMSLLWTRPMGLKMLYGAVGLTIIGTLIIRKIVRIRV